MDGLPGYGLANTATAFATLFGGLLPLALCVLGERHPPRWMLVYGLVALTGVFTITLHGFGETNPVLGERWVWSCLDTGSNILVAWGIARAALEDLYAPATRRRWAPALLALLLAGVAWHCVDRRLAGGYLVGFGPWGGFRPGQTWLVALSFLAAALFFAKRRAIAPKARPLLGLVLGLFLCGLLLATARNDNVVYPFLSLHALWHVVGAFGFLALWAFNDVRFRAPG